MPLKTKNQLERITEWKKHYINQSLNLSNGMLGLQGELEAHFETLSVENQVMEKMKEEIERIKVQGKRKIDRVREESKSEIREMQEEKENLLELMAQDKQETCLALNNLIANKSSTMEKLQELIDISNYTPIIDPRDLGGMETDQINEILEGAEEVESYIRDIDIDSFKTDYIDKKFWYFTEGANEGIRAINVLGVLTLVAVFSDFLVIGVVGTTGVLFFRNWNKLKPVKEYKNYIMTVYEMEVQIREELQNRVERGYKTELEELENQMGDLDKEELIKKENIKKGLEIEISNVKSKYLNEIEKSKADVERELKDTMIQIKSRIRQVSNEIGDSLDQFKTNLTPIETALQKQLEELNNFRLNIQNTNLTLSTKKFHLGQEVEHEDINKFMDLEFGSYIFLFRDEKQGMRNLMKYIVCQYCSRLKGDLIKVNLLDGVDYGEGLSEIIFGDNVDMFFSKEEVDKEVERQINKFTDDKKKIFTSYKYILDYNKAKAKTGSTPYPLTVNLIQNYNIFEDIDQTKQLLRTHNSGIVNLILLSENVFLEYKEHAEKNVNDNDQFISLWNAFSMQFTASYDIEGAITVAKQDVEGAEDRDKTEVSYIEKAEKEKNKLESKWERALNTLTPTVEKYGIAPVNWDTFVNKENEKATETELETFLPINKEDVEFMEMGKQIEQNRVNAQTKIFYFNDFVKQAVPEGTEFTKEVKKGIELCPGYKDGDIELLHKLPLDGEIIHYFLGGRTGMGKSNTLNNMLNTAVRMYSPEDLNIYLMDFKVIEGRKYMRNPSPHFKCISVTDDVYYLMSLFNYLENIMIERQKVILPKYNAGQLKDLRKQGIRIPEIMVVIDEFTEALKVSDDMARDILQKTDTIARLGRASGVHLFLTSQEISDKLDEATLAQFSGRLSLPVNTRAISKQIVMNDGAADPDYQGMGNLLSNNKLGAEKANVRLKVPLIEPEDMDENFEYVNNLLKGKFELNCVMFDQEDVTPIGKAREDIHKVRKSLINKRGRTIVMGDNAEFSTVETPVGFPVENEDSNNIAIVSSSKKRRIELCNTVVANYAEVNGENTVLFLLRGNKDYLSYDLAQEYNGKFKDIQEFETLDEMCTYIEGSGLKYTDTCMEEDGWKFEESEFFEQSLKTREGFWTKWQELKSKADIQEPITKVDKAELIEALRPEVSQILAVIEGIEEVEGIGLDYYDFEKYAPIFKYAPYYGVMNVWTAPRVLTGFTKYETSFKHRLLGTLDAWDCVGEYKFMKETPSGYGGYANIINPNLAFKFKRYYLEEIGDDAKVDNRVFTD